MDCSLPGSSIHGIFQARILEWVQKMKIMASSPITLWQMEGEKVETATDFLLLGSKITVDNDCSHEINRCLLLARKAMTNLDSILKSRDIKALYSQSYGFSSSHVWMEKAVASHSSILAWKIPWMEEPGRLQSMESRRFGHDYVTSLSLLTFMHWRRKWQPTPVFLPGESQGWGSLVGCRLWGRTE